MKCIYCNCTESRVVDSRPTEDGAIRRRRECEECKRRFTTYEKIEMLPVLVVKKDRRREPFDAAKVRNGILRACEKRPVPLEEIEKLVRRVETSVCQQPEEEVTTEQIGRKIDWSVSSAPAWRPAIPIGLPARSILSCCLSRLPCW